ncbi:hypothetical protein [Tumebacillus flagellatus]|nr:hypothetical protein [Tumebacillus flagellatus]
MILIVSGCSANPNNTEPENAIEKYLQDKGYQIISAEGKVDEYQITKEKLTQMPYMVNWGLQSVDPTPFLGKNVQITKFIVKNHPLDQWTTKGVKSKKQTELYIYEVDHQVIGGTSIPVVDENLDGGMWSLEGKTLEEVQGKEYPIWRKEWLEKWSRP